MSSTSTKYGGSVHHKPRVEHLNAASPLAKAAELCYVNVGDGKQHSLLCSALSLYNAGLSALIALSVYGKRDVLLHQFYSETQQNIPVYFGGLEVLLYV